MPTKTKVKLRIATDLGDPVYGTSNGSTYITCLITPIFNMAVRVKGGSSFSMRCEPRKKAKFEDMVAKRLVSIGFGVGDEGAYASQHFKAEGGPLIGCGAYGAVCEQLRHLFGAENVTSLPWGDIKDAGN